MHESQLHDENCFITLTYRTEVLSLVHRDFQLFMKRLRRVAGKRFGYFMSGEYMKNGRAHFHACLFGYGFADRKYFKKSKSGFPVYTSALLQSCWPHGYSSCQDFCYQTAAYVAKYTVKKLTGDDSKVYEILDPDTGEIFFREKEYGQPSLRPAIGKRWIAKFYSDVYPRGEVVVNGRRQRPPKFYEKEMRKRGFAVKAELALRRASEFDLDVYTAENQPERLEARETVLRAGLEVSKRNLKETDDV